MPLTWSHPAAPETARCHGGLSARAALCRGSGTVLHLLSVMEISCNGGKNRQKQKRDRGKDTQLHTRLQKPQDLYVLLLAISSPISTE